MPSLIRFLVFIGICVGIVYGIMYALILFVEPNQREMTVRVPAAKINPK